MVLTFPPAATMSTREARSRIDGRLPQAVRLWIDGVGCWLVWLPERMTIGGPAVVGRSSAADLPLLADLQRVHATIERGDEQYRLASHGPATINGLAIEGEAGLRSGDEIALNDNVRLELTIPTQLSNTARLVCTSGHRPEQRIDGVVLLEQMCQLGPQDDHHIVCPRAESSFVLFKKGEALWCRSSQEWTLQGRSVSGAAPLEHGALVATESLSFRLEIA